MKGNPDRKSQNARARMDRQDAHRKATALTRKIGDRRATPKELETLASLRNQANGR